VSLKTLVNVGRKFTNTKCALLRSDGILLTNFQRALQLQGRH